MLAGFGHLALSVRLTVVVVPVALYFLVLGLLNTRRHPQLLSARTDFCLLCGALAPLFVVPALGFVGCGPLAVTGLLGLAAAVGLMLMPRGRQWVVYNLSVSDARRAVGRALEHLGQPFDADGNVFRLAGGCEIHLSGFGLLRNVSIRIVTENAACAGEIERKLSDLLGGMCIAARPSMVAMLLVATAMLVVPLTLVAGRAGEIVAILSDFLK